MSVALVVAAHGSHYNAGAALPAWRCVDKIRQLGLFDEVTAAFWKEQPSLGTVLDGLTSEHIIVVPLFSSEGYFSQAVLPAELQPRQHVKITSTVGSSDYFAPIVADRIEKALTDAEIPPPETAVVIVGHGTPRHKHSSGTTEYQAVLMRKTGRFAEVHTAYLDQEPYIAAIEGVVASPTIVVVPFFIAEGLHTQEDIPEALGLTDPLYAPQFIKNHCILYTPPVGLEDDLYQVVLQLALESGGQFKNVGGLRARQLDFEYRNHFAAPLKPAPTQIQTRRMLGDEVEAPGQISLHHPDYLCHMDDIHRTDLESLDTPEAIRAKLRFTDSGEFRPLATSTDLPHGWQIPTPDESSRTSALQTIYPGEWKVETTRSLQEVGARQKGKYRPVENLSSEKIAFLVHTVCSNCVRHPSWHDGNTDIVPGCIEPCSIFLEEAIK